MSDSDSKTAREIKEFLRQYSDRDPVTGRLIENGLLLKETAAQEAL
jgi:hypothetical protein